MTLQEEDTSWFLAQLKPNCAAVANGNLIRQGFRTFLPMEEETRKRSGRFVTALRPLFPGYIFVAFDPRGGLWRSINSTYGITQLVRLGVKPAVVPDALVSELALRCDESGKLLPPEQINVGDKVRLTNGPFAKMVAEIVSFAPDKRVWVLLDILGGQTRVAVPSEQLRPV